MKWRTMVLLLLLSGWWGSGAVHAAPAHPALNINGVPVQLPHASRAVGDDRLVDVCSLQGILPITVGRRGEEWIIRYGRHQLEVEPGRTAALLDGRWLLLKHAPVAVNDGLLMPNRQLFDLLAIPYHMEEGRVNVTVPSATLDELQRQVAALYAGRSQVGFVAVLQPNRWMVASQIRIGGRPVGYGDWLEAAREESAGRAPTWKLTKRLPISDTTGRVYLEWMPDGSIFANIMGDKRPELLVVETCDCAGYYRYATMFTVTEMGLVPVWHSQASYERLSKTSKGWELVTHRKEEILNRPGNLMPYWEIHEVWNGRSFEVTRQEYHDPLQ